MADWAKLAWVYVFSILFNGFGSSLLALRVNLFTLCTRSQNDRNLVNLFEKVSSYLLVGTAVTLTVGSVLYYTATSIESLQAIWLLCCGLHSWYTQSERLGAKSIYDACTERAHELNVDFTAFVAQATPQWNSIVIHLAEASKGLDEYEVYKSSHSEEQDAISALYSDMSAEESLDHLKTVENARWALEHYAVVLEKVIVSSEAVDERLTKLLSSFCIYLQGKGWTYDKYDQIIAPLLTRLGNDAFWAFAESNASQLSDYDYQTSIPTFQ